MFLTVLQKRENKQYWVSCGEIYVGSTGFSWKSFSSWFQLAADWFLTFSTTTSPYHTNPLCSLSSKLRSSQLSAVPFQFYGSRATLGAPGAPCRPVTTRSYGVWCVPIIRRTILWTSLFRMLLLLVVTSSCFSCPDNAAAFFVSLVQQTTTKHNSINSIIVRRTSRSDNR